MIDKALPEEERKFQQEANRVRLGAQRSQVRLYFVLAAVTFSPLLSLFLYFNTAKNILDERLAELTTVIVNSAASQIDPQAHALIVAQSGTGSAEYNQLVNRLSTLQNNVQQIASLRTLVAIDDQVFIVLDSGRNNLLQSGAQTLDMPGFMEPYDDGNVDALKAYLASAGNGDSGASAPFISDSTTHIERCIPLTPIPNAFPTLVCVDIAATAYFEQRDRMRNNFLLASLLVFSITAFILYSVVQHQRQVRLSMALLRKQRDYFLKSSRTDSLTGAMNRRAFQRSYAAAEAQLNRNKIPFAVIAIDIDNFKPINDTYGHDAGDQVLISLVAELSRLLRKSDYLARMGGEEFCVLCTLNVPGQAIFVAEKLRKAVEALKVTLQDARFIELTISLGIHEVSLGQSMEDALKSADIALYAAKAQGRNRSVFYTDGMEKDLRGVDLVKSSFVEHERAID
ncbi:MAG: GGDEF domain-containing protein [Pseudomonadota bacterium]